VSSALLGFAEELLLGRAVSLQHCPLVMNCLHPRSPAQLSSRGPAQYISLSAPFGLPQSVFWSPGEPAVKQPEGITDFPSLSWVENLTTSRVITPREKELGMRMTFSLSYLSRATER